MKFFISLLSLWFLSACAIVVVDKAPPPITSQERELLNNPPSELLRAIEDNVPRMSAGTREAEAIALKYGRSLTQEEMSYARQVGVNHPEKIRIYFTNDFPIDEKSLGPGGIVVALTMNYGIFVKPQITKHPKSYREIIVHEFAHVVQFERLGIEGMARKFMLETFVLRDKLNLMEREAIAMGNAVYDDPNTNYGF